MLSITVLVFAFFPYIGLVKDVDTQPYFALFSLLYVFYSYHSRQIIVDPVQLRVSLRMSFLYVVFIAFGSYAGLSLGESIHRIIFYFINLFVCPFAIADLLRKRPLLVLKFANYSLLIWSAVALIQFYLSKNAFSFLVPSVDHFFVDSLSKTGRGVFSLAPEPTWFSRQSILLATLAISLNNLLCRYQFRVFNISCILNELFAVFLAIISVLLSQSALGFLYLMLFLLSYCFCLCIRGRRFVAFLICALFVFLSVLIVVNDSEFLVSFLFRFRAISRIADVINLGTEANIGGFNVRVAPFAAMVESIAKVCFLPFLSRDPNCIAGFDLTQGGAPFMYYSGGILLLLAFLLYVSLPIFTFFKSIASARFIRNSFSAIVMSYFVLMVLYFFESSLANPGLAMLIAFLYNVKFIKNEMLFNSPTS